MGARDMGQLLMFIAFTLPVASGALRWTWWMVPLCGVASVIGFFVANPDIFERAHAESGLPQVIGSTVVMTSVACAALFGVGHLLSLLAALFGVGHLLNLL
jgi:hypothetical protein